MTQCEKCGVTGEARIGVDGNTGWAECDQCGYLMLSVTFGCKVSQKVVLRYVAGAMLDPNRQRYEVVDCEPLEVGSTNA